MDKKKTLSRPKPSTPRAGVKKSEHRYEGGGKVGKRKARS